MARSAWPGPRRIAHRGGGTLAPENTLAALATAVAWRYRGVEFDVMLTADDVPVLMHDAAFGRTIAGPGRMAETTFAELAARDAGAWFGAATIGEPVPAFVDVVRFCRAHGVWMNVEIKPSPGTEGRTGRIVAETTAALFGDGAGDPLPLFSSFSTEALAAARDAAPRVPRALLVGGVSDDAEAVAGGLGCVALHADHRRLDRATVARLHGAGLAVLAYTANEAARVRWLDDAGVDAVVTDRLDLIEPDAS